MRLAFDLSIQRHPPAGTSRYASELLSAMTADLARPEDEILPIHGWPRLRRGRRFGRYLNVALDLGWYTAGSQVAAARGGVDAWFSPANIIPFWLPRPTVVTIHDVNFFQLAEAYDPAYRRWATVNFRRSAQRATRILVDSHFVGEELKARFDIPEDRIRVAHLGIEHALRAVPASTRAGPAGRYALFVGQTEPHKNVGLLFDAWRLGVPSDLHLVVAGGPGRDDARLRERAAAPDLRHRVHLLGAVDERRLARLYADAHMFLFPSLLEGFGLPPLEAMARGIPTAVANRTSLPEITGGAAILFDPIEPKALATVVQRLADDVELREQLRRAGLDWSAQFRWHATAKQAWLAVREAAADD